MARPVRFWPWIFGAATLLATLLGHEAHVRADPPAAETLADDPAGLVRQLGDESFQRREAATARLSRLGLEAKAALVRGMESPDAEVRIRCRRVLGDVLELDFRQRVRRFAEGTDGGADDSVPAWNDFRQTAGDSKGARDLYVEMLDAEPELLESLAGEPRRVPELLAVRLQQVQMRRAGTNGGQQPRDVSLGSIATYLFVSSHEQVQLAEPTLNEVVRYVNYPAFQQGIVSGPKVEPLRHLLVNWIERDTVPPQIALMLALRHQLPEGVPPALKLLAQPDKIPQFRVQALLVVARFGTLAQVPEIERLLQDSSGVNFRTPNSQGVTEIRDIALATLIKISGQKFTDYGLTKIVEHQQMAFDTTTIGFPDATARTQAHEKWTAWSASHAAEIEAARAMVGTPVPNE